MAIVINNAVAGPATHALVIGAGSYPHGAWGLGDLHGAPDSAVAFIEWLQHEFPQQGAPPLASVDVVLSPTANSQPYAAPNGAQVERATIANVEAAVTGWFQRCNTHEDNLALFYFCGHGVEKGLKSSLLCEDFGAHPLDIMQDAIGFDDFSLGMDTCRAVNQCFILDACRNLPPQAARLNGHGRAIVAPDIDGRPTPTPRNYAVLYGTSSQNRAYGQDQGSVSQFTSALLQALRGAAWDDLDNPWTEWSLRVELMIPAINDVLKLHEKHENGMPQQARISGSSTRMLLMRTQQAPKVPVVVLCDPEARAHQAVLTAQQNGTVVAQRNAGGTTAPWLLQLDANAVPYSVEATANAMTNTARLMVRPPFRETTVRVP